MRYLINFIIIFIIILIQCSPKESNQSYYFNDIKIISQNEWGGVNIKHTAKLHQIDKITLHHGGVEFKSDKDPNEYLKNLQSWSRSEKKWIDIPYHYLLDLEGNIYQGRSTKYPGDTNTDYDTNGHLLICVLGNYEMQELNDKQINSLVDLLVYFCYKFNLKPRLIKAHRDYTDTACPGKNFYKYLNDGSLINKVENRLSTI